MTEITRRDLFLNGLLVVGLVLCVVVLIACSVTARLVTGGVVHEDDAP